MVAAAQTCVHVLLRLCKRTTKLRAEPADAGYAAVDALVAATILTSTMIFAIEAGYAARHAGQAAFEVRRASSLLRYLMQTDGPPTSGQTGGFKWDVSTSQAPEMTSASLPTCDREVNATSITTGRRYHLQTDIFCPPDNR